MNNQFEYTSVKSHIATTLIVRPYRYYDQLFCRLILNLEIRPKMVLRWYPQTNLTLQLLTVSVMNASITMNIYVS